MVGALVQLVAVGLGTVAIGLVWSGVHLEEMEVHLLMAVVDFVGVVMVQSKVVAV